MEREELEKTVVSALEELKAVDIRVMDVRGRCSFADTIVVASGTSDRHLKALADNVVGEAKKGGVRPLGVEGMDVANTEWVLVDLVDVVVHVMLPQARDFYQLEKFWSAPPAEE
ncbi:MAG: ribosome silencing factor [Halothiobacillaceae bacterium]